ncbi:acetoacetate decarboxylase [Rhodothalassium salexigens]|uniref:acetoacetate decarboxylase n=1 Tax=Rhodothalassium salexigens TaxID=1086 RepID=UPI00191176D9|nr:acetoacetate decarboxylase [Rhodothalassium salexigens]MBK5912107.1 acetoacetate decarboxylase [Rhodothalassium salexigens]MBK5919952.1 acetoacetate decarboxylase [Rhodothalassium salexigens]
MKLDNILSRPAMPLANPSYPVGPFRFVDREGLYITYETDPAAIRALVPAPLEPDGSGQVVYEWLKMPDAGGFGAFEESGVVIPCRLDGEPVNFIAMMFLNNEPAITAGREIWGFPKRWGEPHLAVARDTLTGTLDYAGERVALGSMAYKHENLADQHDRCAAMLAKTQINLKLLPCVTGKPLVAQLVAYALTDITVKGFWAGPARLALTPHVNAPVADLPVRRVVGAIHFVADLTLPYGRVVHDFLSP